MHRHKEDGKMMRKMQEVLLKTVTINKEQGLGVSSVDARLAKETKIAHTRINPSWNGHV